MITQGELKGLLKYVESTGVFTRLISRSPRVSVGDIAGTLSNNGYISISFKRERYLAHRLVWLYKTGGWPESIIDHINGDKADNRFENLREASNSENQMNSRKKQNNVSGFKGVCWDSSTKSWKASASIGRKHRHIGRFDTPEAASAAYEEFARKNHGEFYYATS